MSKSDLGDSLITTVARAGGTDLLTDAAEFSLDQILRGDLVKEIPIFGTLARLYKVGVGIRDYLFVKKLLRFFGKLSDISQEERERFGKRMDEDEGYRQKVGDHIVLVLDRLDDVSKAELAGRIFRAFVQAEIDLETLLRFCVAIDRCLVSELNEFMEWGNSFDMAGVRSLSSAGLMETKAIPIDGRFGPEHYTIAPLGTHLNTILHAHP